MLTRDEIIAMRQEALEKLKGYFEKRMFEQLKQVTARVHDNSLDAIPYVIKIEPPWIRNMNSSQRRKAYRHLTKKWETQIAVHQVKARLAGKRATSADVLAVQMETADQEQRKRNRQAVRASAKVAGPRFSDGRGL